MCSNILGLITDHWSLITSVLGRSEEISHADVLTRLKSTRINSPYVVLYKENSRKMHLKLLRLWWVWWHWCLPQRLAQIAQEACSPQLCNKPSANHTQRQALHNLKFTYLCLNIFMITPNTLHTSHSNLWHFPSYSTLDSSSPQQTKFPLKKLQFER